MRMNLQHFTFWEAICRVMKLLGPLSLNYCEFGTDGFLPLGLRLQEKSRSETYADLSLVPAPMLKLVLRYQEIIIKARTILRVGSMSRG